jgi:5'(3')-deoxyribonucleotidase
MRETDHKVFLDCDGVFADFLAGMCAALGIPYRGTKFWQEDFNNYWFWRIHGFTDEQAEAKCTSDFWAELPWTEDGKELMEGIKKRLSPDDVMLLTKPMENDESYTGKVRWVTEHLPELRFRTVPTRVDKHEFAHNSRQLLIDDMQQNHDAFVEVGGSCILVPRPWNKNAEIYYAGDTVPYVLGELDHWMCMKGHVNWQKTLIERIK